MLDYDYLCGRNSPSIAAIVHPSKPASFQKFFMGAKEILIPIYSSTEEAVSNHPEASALLNFASFRSAYDVTIDALKYPSLKNIYDYSRRNSRETGKRDCPDC